VKTAIRFNRETSTQIHHPSNAIFRAGVVTIKKKQDNRTVARKSKDIQGVRSTMQIFQAISLD